jgi:NitT/TauT family transport system substrate-binding protein
MNRPLRNTLLFAVAALAVATSACSKSHTSPPGTTHYVLALDWVPEPEFGGFYAARENGTFRKHGLDIEIRGGGAGVPVVQMVASGKADFGVVGADEVLAGRTHAADVVAVFATFQTSPQAIMVHASHGYKTLGETLHGGTLAIEPGMPYAAFLKKKYGAFGARVVPYDGGVARFMVDHDYAQQCYVTAEPIAARSKGGDPQVFLVADEGFNPYTGVVIVGRKLMTEHPEMVREFVSASGEGWSAYLDDRAAMAATNAVLAKLNPSMDAETSAAAAFAERPLIEAPGPGSIGVMTRERWTTLGKQLVDIGAIPSAPSPDDYLPAAGGVGLGLPLGSKLASPPGSKNGVPGTTPPTPGEALPAPPPAAGSGAPPPPAAMMLPGMTPPPGSGLLPWNEAGRLPVPGEDAAFPPPPGGDAAPLP